MNNYKSKYETLRVYQLCQVDKGANPKWLALLLQLLLQVLNVPLLVAIRSSSNTVEQQQPREPQKATASRSAHMTFFEGFHNHNYYVGSS